MSWLDDMLGIFDVIDRTSGSDVELPRRQKLRVKGDATLVDKPSEGIIELTVAPSSGGVTTRAATSVIGRAAGTAGAAADITASSNDTFLQRVGGALAWGALTIGMIPDALITAAKLTGVLEMAYTASVTASRNIALTDAFKAMLVDSTSGAVVITLVQDATVNIPVGQSGFIRWAAGSNQVSVAAGAGATVDSSGTELKLARVKAQIYWEKTAANTYYISGEKMV